MTVELLVMCLAAIAAVPLVWLFPKAYAQDAVAIFTMAVLVSVSMQTAVWLLASTALTFCALRLSDRVIRPEMVLMPAGMVLIAVLMLGREMPYLEVIGTAYLTMRNLHLLFDRWMEKGDGPASLREALHYQCFLPVLAAGPINRFPEFRRALRTRHASACDIATGAERALTGVAMAVILGSYVMGRVQRGIAALLAEMPPFAAETAASALGWVQLYFVFAGLSAFAVGTSAMMGLRIEENFDRPYLARSLLDFWTRWHMTLASWCRDYVFQPVTAATRKPVLGLISAMVVVGLWHETSVYYVLWSLWQVTGIVLNRVLVRWSERRSLTLHPAVARIVAPALILGWLSLARPVLTRLLEVIL